MPVVHETDFVGDKAEMSIFCRAKWDLSGKKIIFRTCDMA